MSIKPMTWALYDAPVADPQQLLILWAMADRANDDGTACWASNGWIAARARCSTRTVQRHLKALEEGGIIRRGDQELVAHFRHDRRPIVWDIVMDPSERGDNLSPEPCNEVTPGAERGDTDGGNGVTTVSDNTSFLPTEEHVLDTSSLAPVTGVEAEFAAWYKAYPKKSNKPAALKAYKKARKVKSAEFLFDAMMNFPWNPDHQYVPYPSSWLNGERWDDDYAALRQRQGGGYGQKPSIRETAQQMAEAAAVLQAQMDAQTGPTQLEIGS